MNDFFKTCYSISTPPAHYFSVADLYTMNIVALTFSLSFCRDSNEMYPGWGARIVKTYKSSLHSVHDDEMDRGRRAEDLVKTSHEELRTSHEEL